MTFKEFIDLVKQEAGVMDEPGINGRIAAEMTLNLDWLRGQILMYDPEILKTETDIALDGTVTPVSSQNLCSPTNYYIGDIVKITWEDTSNKSVLEYRPDIIGKTISGGYPLYYYKLGCTLYFAPSVQTSGTLTIVHYQKLKDFMSHYGATSFTELFDKPFDLSTLLNSSSGNPYIENNIIGFTNAYRTKVALSVARDGDIVKGLVEKLQLELQALMMNRPNKGRVKSPYERVWKEVK